uniref:Ubiquitin carboxyl-terminal hydrolase n=1 Tax=Magallana gigas TaxID=29159 RepID=A0A8W8MI99_MAGGI
MECPHLEDNACITTPNIKSENLPSRFVCGVCKTEQSPWICVKCGRIHCGRYVNGHAKLHHEEATNHAVCMDCDNLAVFCYKCDEFVINDTAPGHLEKLRQQLKSISSAQARMRQKSRRRCSTDSQENEKATKKIKKDDRLSKPRSSGLRNLGNTCFMNAVLQSLSNIQQFCGYIKQLPSLEEKVTKVKKIQTRKSKTPEEDVLLVEELRKTLCALWQGSKGAISPESLFAVIWKVVPRFRGYQQQDAHEFMRYLLDRLHTELLTLLPYPNSDSPFIGPKGKSTIVTAIFGGLLQNEVTCLVCGVESKKHDPFLDLSLDIPQQFCTRGVKAKDGEQLRCTLSDCLQSFTELEELEESELYMCSTCKKKQRSTKKFWIRRLPNHETRGSGSGSNEYDLAAVVVHHGSGAGSGHYTSYARHEGQWFHFNDSTVTPCEPETVAKCKAYILFYIRRQFKVPDYLSIRNGK